MQQAWDKNGRIYYIDDNGNKVQPKTTKNAFERLGMQAKASLSNINRWLQNADTNSQSYKDKVNVTLGLLTAPIGGSSALAAKGAGALAPFFGKKIAQSIASNAVGGATGGAVEGFGRGLVEQKNPIKTAVQDGTIGLVSGGILGGVVGRVGKHFDYKNLYKNPTQKAFDKYRANYVDNLIGDYNNIDDISKLPTITQTTPFNRESNKLRMAYQGLKPSEVKVDKPQYLFAGENAQTADKVALNKAKEMFDNGIDNETIRQNTGWFKGVDDKWRFEIPDGELKETATYDIVEDSLGLPLEEYHYKLNDLYDAPELYKTYPQLTNTKIIFENMPQGFNGYAMPLDNEIHLNKDMAQILNKKYVQRLEELEQTPEYKFYNENVFKNNGDYDLKVEEDFLNTPIGEEWGDLQWDNVHGLPKYINKGNDVKLKSKLSHELQHMVQDIENFAKGGSYKNPNYRNLAGEVEARTAANRAFLKDEDRLKYSPIDGKNIFYGYDTPVKEQIVDFSYGSSLYDKLIDNTVDLTNNFDKSPTIQEVKSHIKDLIDSGKVFDTLDDDWKIDVRGNTTKIDHIAKSSQYGQINKAKRNRHNKYVMSLEDLINNSKYTNNPKANTKLHKKPNIDTYHYFETNVKIGDKKLQARLNDNGGKNKLFDLLSDGMSEEIPQYIKKEVVREPKARRELAQQLAYKDGRYNSKAWKDYIDKIPEKEILEVINPEWEKLNPYWDYPKLGKNSVDDIIEHYDSNTSTERIGRGYSGYSMSNNAVKAYDLGSKPLSKWKKQDILNSIENISNQYGLDLDINEFKKLKTDELKNFLAKDGYHHTSKYYNVTDFYKPDIYKLLKIDD